MKVAAEMSVAEFKQWLEQSNERLIYFWERYKYADHFQHNGLNMKNFRGRGSVMRRR